MGKKKVTTQTNEAALKEGAAVDAAVAKTGGKKSKRVEKGRVYINASYNNTVDHDNRHGGQRPRVGLGRILGFSGPKKATPFASSKVIAALVEKVQATGPKEVDVIVKGIGSGRDSAIRALITEGFVINSIKDVTPVPHNGPRPPKVRRV